MRRVRPVTVSSKAPSIAVASKPTREKTARAVAAHTPSSGHRRRAWPTPADPTAARRTPRAARAACRRFLPRSRQGPPGAGAHPAGVGSVSTMHTLKVVRQQGAAKGVERRVHAHRHEDHASRIAHALGDGRRVALVERVVDHHHGLILGFLRTAEAGCRGRGVGADRGVDRHLRFGDRAGIDAQRHGVALQRLDEAHHREGVVGLRLEAGVAAVEDVKRRVFGGAHVGLERRDVGARHELRPADGHPAGGCQGPSQAFALARRISSQW